MKSQSVWAFIFGIYFATVPVTIPTTPAIDKITVVWSEFPFWYNTFILYWVGVAIFEILVWLWHRTNEVEKARRELLKTVKGID